MQSSHYYSDTMSLERASLAAPFAERVFGKVGRWTLFALYTTQYL